MVWIQDQKQVQRTGQKIIADIKGRQWSRSGRGDIDLLSEISPRIWGVYCVDRVEMCGQILLDIQRKVESVYEVKGKI